MNIVTTWFLAGQWIYLIIIITITIHIRTIANSHICSLSAILCLMLLTSPPVPVDATLTWVPELSPSHSDTKPTMFSQSSGTASSCVEEIK
jgi:hypothetical protein